MNRTFSARLSSSEETHTDGSSIEIRKEETLTVEYTEDDQSKPIHRSREARTTSGSYLVDYGPIRVRHRLTPSHTFATGRRSKDDPLSLEEAAKRDTRRAKNRLAARELKKARDQIESDLIQQIKELEEENVHLEEQHKKLGDHKAQLNRAVYNARQTPLIPLVVDMDIPLFFELQHGRDTLVDLQPLLETIDEDFNSFHF